MRKYALMAAAAVMMTACQPGNEKKHAVAADKDEVLVETYVGNLPAADGPGIIYELTLNAESLENVYSLDMVYLEGGCDGNDTVYNVKGRIQHLGKNAMKLIPVNGDPEMFFKQVNDSTLRLVNDQLEEAESGINYDLKKK